VSWMPENLRHRRGICENPGILHGLLCNRDGDDIVEEWIDLCLDLSASVPSGYSEMFEILTATLGRPRIHETVTPLSVGLGVGHVLEQGMALHSVFGTPLIYGSTIKGLLIRQALARLGLDAKKIGEASDKNLPPQWSSISEISDFDREAMSWLFGDAGGIGALTVYDAVWAPQRGPFWMKDIVTPHNGPYYKGDGGALPDDTAGPVPVPRLSCPPGAAFAFWLKTPDEEWTEFAWELLTEALASLGAGGKTSSGYGRMKKIRSDIEIPAGQAVQERASAAPAPFHAPVAQAPVAQAPAPAPAAPQQEPLRKGTLVSGGLNLRVKDERGQEFEIFTRSPAHRVGMQVTFEMRGSRAHIVSIDA
jgi:CRISPR type III-B/RAMP module RAMP protein Cmr6